MRLLILSLFLFGCGTTLRDYVEPAYPLAIEACRIAQERAVERAETREEAVEAVTLLQEQCDIGYAGLNALLEIDDLVRLKNVDEDKDSPQEEEGR